MRIFDLITANLLFLHRMSFGQRLLEARKKKSLSQEELAKMMSTKGPAIGRYERDEMKPSIEAAARMAVLLDVSLDYLVGNADLQLDTATLKRMGEVAKLSEEDKKCVYALLDAFIANSKFKTLMQ